MSLPPIFVADLFPLVSERTVAVLRGLSPEEWNLPTVSSKRRVRDVASHLLDGSLRRLSLHRDGYQAPDGSAQPREGESLVAFLARLNEEWEVGTRRLSPRVIVDLMEQADRELAAWFASLDPFKEAIFPVVWAGEERSANWMDVARDYTEKWHHAQQIFDAIGRPSTITERRLFHPCLDIFLRALPWSLRDADAPRGAVATVRIVGDAGGEWNVARGDSEWDFVQRPVEDRPACIVTLSQESAWKVFTRRLDAEAALQRFPDIHIEGDRRLGCAVVEMVSVMA
ncbi:MAG TPA: maleylpyruvate isomerase N-terminal domain-containing protein [Pirellulaceae bacterium]|jgi:hypothetical protein|nr:maleylpyruvate isomerase N-terminal domain-containing protein [Pirellulaceae bacterium]